MQLCYFNNNCVTNTGKQAISEVRQRYRSALRHQAYEVVDTMRYITETGVNLINDSLLESVRRIRGSYFGMLQGRWPLHLLTETPLPAETFASDTLRCHVTGYESGNWMFTPSSIQPDSEGWFELQFNLPEDIANLVSENWGDRKAVANIKQEYFSYINLSGIIGNIRRSVRLELDTDWINDYIQRLQRRT